MSADRTPLLDHPIADRPVFTPGDLMAAVRRERQLVATPVPPLCVLDFDGELAHTTHRRAGSELS